MTKEERIEHHRKGCSIGLGGSRGSLGYSVDDDRCKECKKADKEHKSTIWFLPPLPTGLKYECQDYYEQA